MIKTLKVNAIMQDVSCLDHYLEPMQGGPARLKQWKYAWPMRYTNRVQELN
jgi:hypothetical protein